MFLVHKQTWNPHSECLNLGLENPNLSSYLLLSLCLCSPGVFLHPLGNDERGLGPCSLVLVLLAYRFVKIGSQSGTQHTLKFLFYSMSD